MPLKIYELYILEKLENLYINYDYKLHEFLQMYIPFPSPWEFS